MERSKHWLKEFPISHSVHHRLLCNFCGECVPFAFFFLVISQEHMVKPLPFRSGFLNILNTCSFIIMRFSFEYVTKNVRSHCSLHIHRLNHSAHNCKGGQYSLLRFMCLLLFLFVSTFLVAYCSSGIFRKRTSNVEKTPFDFVRISVGFFNPQNISGKKKFRKKKQNKKHFRSLCSIARTWTIFNKISIRLVSKPHFFRDLTHIEECVRVKRQTKLYFLLKLMWK